MRHFVYIAEARLLRSTRKTPKQPASGKDLKSLATSVRPLSIAACLAFLLTYALAQGDSICFLTVLKRADSGFSQAQNLVINDPAEWQSVWEKVFANTNPKPPLPEIDFTRRTIIAVFQGPQPTTGYAISIEGLVETEALLEVTAKAFSAERCVVSPKVTSPLHIVEIEKTNKVINFNVKRKILCRQSAR